MARVLNVSENNYRLRVQSGGKITLDTGENTGDVIITGNLTVLGDYTTISVSDMKVEDNIIELNNGESGAGITKVVSGILINRGTLDNAEVLFDESVTHYDPYTSTDINGTFVLKTEDGKKSGLQLSTIVVDTLHNFKFDFKNTFKNLEVVNIAPDDYSYQVFGSDPYPELIDLPDSTDQDNYLTTKRYIKSYIASGAYTPGQADVVRIFKKTGGIDRSKVETYVDDIKFTIGDFTNPSNLRAKINGSGLYVDNINIFNQTIRNVTSGLNLILTADNKNVEFDAVLNLDDQVGATVLPMSGTTKIYSRSDLGSLAQTPGRTGIFFASSIRSDELVSKNRALLFSILF